MTKQTIAVDIDDVLADNAAGFVAFSNSKWGTRLSVDDYDEHWAKLWRVDHEETARRADLFHVSGVVKKYQKNTDALDVLLNLHKSFRLVIITSRRLSLKEDTYEWINLHFPNIFEEIHFAGIWDVIDEGSVHATKADIALEIGADYLIDDQIKHCSAAASVGIESILFGDYTWNYTDTLPKGVYRAASWQKVEDYFNGKI